MFSEEISPKFYFSKIVHNFGEIGRFKNRKVKSHSNAVETSQSQVPMCSHHRPCLSSSVFIICLFIVCLTEATRTLGSHHTPFHHTPPTCLKSYIFLGTNTCDSYWNAPQPATFPWHGMA